MSHVPLHHELTGGGDAGPALLLGGSLGTDLTMWAPQRGPLSASRPVVAFDHRGHGRSPAPPGPYDLDLLGGDVLALLDALGLDRVDYAGLSIGGMVGLWLAINAPERIRRLVIICSSAKVDGAAFRARAQTVRAAGTAAAVADAVIERWFTPAYAAGHPDVIARMRAMIAATPAEGYAGCCEAIAAMDLEPGLPRIGASTLVIGASEDPALPAGEHSEPIARAIPAARYELVGPAAHIATIEQAERINALIVGHLGAA